MKKKISHILISDFSANDYLCQAVDHLVPICRFASLLRSLSLSPLSFVQERFDSELVRIGFLNLQDNKIDLHLSAELFALSYLVEPSQSLAGLRSVCKDAPGTYSTLERVFRCSYFF